MTQTATAGEPIGVRLVADLSMPGRDGMDLLRRVRLWWPTDHCGPQPAKEKAARRPTWWNRERPDQPMCKPPLQEKSAPVVKPESGPASQAQMEPISSGVPRRLTGMVPTIFSSTSGLMALTMSVPM